MSLRSLYLARIALFVLAIALAFAVTVTGLGGVFVFGGRSSRFADLFYVYYPLLAFPISLIALFLPRSGVLSFSIYVVGDWLFQFLISWPQLAINPLNSYSSDALVCAAALFWIGLLFNSPREHSAA